jgi:hypothetical protein
MFAVTEMQPLPPCARKIGAVASSPESSRGRHVMVSVMSASTPVTSTLITWIRALFAAVAYLRHEIAETLADTYHPEMHYMRGPGPKWCEKHGAALGLTNRRR